MQHMSSTREVVGIARIWRICGLSKENNARHCGGSTMSSSACPKPPEVTYHVYINVLCKAERFNDAERIFKCVGENDEAKLDARSYNLMIETYGKAGRFSD